MEEVHCRNDEESKKEEEGKPLLIGLSLPVLKFFSVFTYRKLRRLVFSSVVGGF